MTGMVIGQASSFLPDYSKAAAAGGIIFKTLDIIPFIDVFSKRGQYPVRIHTEMLDKSVKPRK